MAKTEANVTIYGRLSYPRWTYQEALAANASAPQPRQPDQVTPDFNLLLEQPQFDKLKTHVLDVFFPWLVERHKAGEKRNALDATHIARLTKQVESDWTEQPPYIPFKPVSAKTLEMMPNAITMLKVVGPRGADVELRAVVMDEDELRVPDPDILTFPIVRPIGQTMHQMYPGAYVGATLNLYSFLSGKVPGFSASASVAVFKADADRFGGGVQIDEDEIFAD